MAVVAVMTSAGAWFSKRRRRRIAAKSVSGGDRGGLAVLAEVGFDLGRLAWAVASRAIGSFSESIITTTMAMLGTSLTVSKMP